MSFKIETQRTIQVSRVDDYLLTWVEAFLIYASERFGHFHPGKTDGS